MNEETARFMNNTDFECLFEELHKKHKPSKAVVTPDVLENIGRVAVNFQRLEYTIKSFIGMLAGIDQGHMQSLVTGLPFKKLLDSIVAIAVKTEFARHDDLKLLVRMAGMAEGLRNQIIHSVWTSGPRLKTALDRKKGIVHKFEHYERGDVEQIAAKIGEVDTAFAGLMFAWLEGLPR